MENRKIKEPTLTNYLGRVTLIKEIKEQDLDFRQRLQVGQLVELLHQVDNPQPTFPTFHLLCILMAYLQQRNQLSALIEENYVCICQ